MKTIANHLTLVCAAVLLSACASSGSSTASRASIDSVPENLRAEVMESKKTGFNASFRDAGNFYANNIKLNEVDLSKYENGLHTMDLEYRQGSNKTPYKMKFYQRTYSIAGLIYPATAQKSTDVHDATFGGYTTPRSYFDTISAEYTYTGIAMTASENGNFTYNLSINHGTATGHGTVTGLTELGTITLAPHGLTAKDGTLAALEGAALFTSGAVGKYSIAMSGPNAEEAVGAIQRDSATESGKQEVIILSGQR